MVHLKRLLAIAIGIAVPVQTWASSDDAWQKLFARANGTCIGESRMDTSEASTPVVFDDSVGKIAILLRGSLGKGKSKTTTELICLYDKKTGKADIAEYHWLGK